MLRSVDAAVKEPYVERVGPVYGTAEAHAACRHRRGAGLIVDVEFDRQQPNQMSQRHVILKGRQMGKSSLVDAMQAQQQAQDLQDAVDLAMLDKLLFGPPNQTTQAFSGGPFPSSTFKTATGPTFQQMQDAYDAAVQSQKSQPLAYFRLDDLPNLTPTATSVGINHMNQRNNVDAVIQREVLPSILKEVPGTDAFKDWSITAFEPAPDEQAFHATIMALSYSNQAKSQGMVYMKRVQVSGNSLQNITDLYHMFTILEDVIKAGVEWIVSQLPAHDPATCTDPECFC